MKRNHHNIIILGTALVAGTMAYAQQGGPQEGIQSRPEMEFHKGSSYADRMHGPEQEAETPGAYRSSRRPDARGPHARPPLMLDLQCAKASGATDDQIKAVSEAIFNREIMRIELQTKIDKADLTLHHLLTQAEQDSEAISKTVDILNDARGAMFKANVLAPIKLRQMLGEAVFLKMQEIQHRGPRNHPDGRMRRNHGQQ